MSNSLIELLINYTQFSLFCSRDFAMNSPFIYDAIHLMFSLINCSF